MLAKGKFYCNSMGKLVENGLFSLGHETKHYPFVIIYCSDLKHQAAI